jgi:hypothetical protein
MTTKERAEIVEAVKDEVIKEVLEMVIDAAKKSTINPHTLPKGQPLNVDAFVRHLRKNTPV